VGEGDATTFGLVEERPLVAPCDEGATPKASVAQRGLSRTTWSPLQIPCGPTSALPFTDRSFQHTFLKRAGPSPTSPTTAYPGLMPSNVKATSARGKAPHSSEPAIQPWAHEVTETVAKSTTISERALRAMSAASKGDTWFASGHL